MYCVDGPRISCFGRRETRSIDTMLVKCNNWVWRLILIPCVRWQRMTIAFLCALRQWLQGGFDAKHVSVIFSALRAMILLSYILQLQSEKNAPSGFAGVQGILLVSSF